MTAAWACPHCQQMHEGQCAAAMHAAAPPDLSMAGLPELQLGVGAPMVLPWAAASQVDYGMSPRRLADLISCVRDAQALLDAPEFGRDQPLERSGYGEPPGGKLATPAYALRVWQQRRALRDALAGQQRACEQARASAGDALAALGMSLCARAHEPDMAPLANDFAAVREADGAAADRSDVQAIAEEQDQAEFAALEARVAEAMGATTGPRTTRDAAAKHELACRKELERAQAMLKRCDIELRALQAAATPDPARIETARQRRPRCAAEEDAARARHVEARATLDQAQAVLTRAEQGVADAERARDDALHAQLERREQYQAEVEAAHGEGRMAAIALCARALAKQLIEREVAEPALAALGELDGAERERALIEAALVSHDADSFRAGVATAGVAALALLVAFVYVLA